ncbi:MAG: sulfite exporter TauE/SafE family protein [Alphaproteobacteria bacterium]|nr:sulfite exporter TauE/SafE family protein [Alphaproteobacteria bacterium]
MEIILLFVAAGFAGGVPAGLFGIGGGLTVVPILYLSLPWLGVDPGVVMHLAIGTSLAVMVVTTMESTYAHNRKGDVVWPEVRKLAPTVALGALAAALCAPWIATDILRYFFIALVVYTIFRALTKKGFTTDYALADFRPPSRTLCLPVGFAIGLVAALLGIGGNPMSVPFMRWARMPMVNASAISAALAFPIAVVGAIGYAASGWGDPGLPAGTTGYVYWPAVPGLLIGALVGVPIGTRLSHRLTDKTSARIYVGFLVVVLVAMIV